MTKVRMTRKPEQGIKREIKELLDALGIYWLPTKGTAHTRAGDPDIVACYRGFFIGIEGKTDVGSQQGQQEARQRAIEDNDGYYVIARSADDVKAVLRQIDKDMAELNRIVDEDWQRGEETFDP